MHLSLIMQASTCIEGCLILLVQAEMLLGSPMTYSLMEYAKENAEELVTVTESISDEQVHTHPYITCLYDKFVLQTL